MHGEGARRGVAQRIYHSKMRTSAHPDASERAGRDSGGRVSIDVALAEYDILDTPPESEFDDFVLLASELLSTPISMISLIDGDRQWFKARVGIDETETPIEQSFCAFAVRDQQTLVVSDATKDSRFAAMANVVGDPGIRFYAGAPLVNPEGVALGTICVIDREPRQITAEEQQSLEALGRQIVAHLEVRRDIRRLRELGRLRDDTLALIAHEFNNPIHAILGFVEMLLDGTLGPLTQFQRTALNSIDHSGARLRSLSADLLLLRELETSSLPLAMESTDLAAIARIAVETAGPMAAHAGVELRSQIDAGVPVVVDPGRIGQTFDNLIANALKFTPAGGTVTVTAARRDGWASFDVTDTGPGIAAEDIVHLFRAFYRVPAARKAGIPGAGLGLAIAAAIVEGHKGNLTVESTPGSGATFRVRLPLNE